jgi:hypothetical protein
MAGDDKDRFQNRTSQDRLQSGSGLGTHRQGGANTGPGWVSDNYVKLIGVGVVIVVIVLAVW